MIQQNDVVVELLRSKTEPCILTELRVNGHEASVWDFGVTKDLASEIAPETGCGDRCFVPCRYADPEIMKDCELSEKDFRTVQSILKKELHIGYCKRCR